MKFDFSQVGNGTPSKGAIKVRIKKIDTPATVPDDPDPFDPDVAKKAFMVYERNIKSFKAEMDKFEIVDDASAAQCTEAVAKSANLIKVLDTQRKEKIKKHDTFVRSVNRFVKVYRDQVEDIVKTGKEKIGAYAYKKEQKRRQAEADAQKAAAKVQDEMDKQAKKGGYEPVQMPAMVAPRESGPVRTESGSASTRMVWTWEEINYMDCPLQYLMIDKKAVDAAIKAGIRDIKGIKIFEKPEVRVRTV